MLISPRNFQPSRPEGWRQSIAPSEGTLLANGKPYSPSAFRPPLRARSDPASRQALFVVIKVEQSCRSIRLLGTQFHFADQRCGKVNRRPAADLIDDFLPIRGRG